jgi:ketosteroid isomerase-like protein
MSQENVELLYRGADAFNRRDLDAYLALMDDDVEVIPRAVALEGGDHYHGHDGVRRWWKDLFDVFPDFTTEVVDAQDLRGDLTLMRLRQRAHGAGSDTPTEESIWNVTRWRREKCVWWRNFPTRDEALEAVGLSQQDVHSDAS